MSIYHFDRLFSPESIAIVGASNKKGTVGAALLDNLVQSGYPHPVFLINPAYRSINGRPVYPTLSSVGSKIDLMIVAIPIAEVPGLIQESVSLGIGAAVIISAGGKETGAKGKKLEEDIWRYASKGGLRIVGPNCLGVICQASKVNATFTSRMPLPGNIAFASQSGAICSIVLDHSLQNQIGFSHFISVGSMLDVDFGDLIDFLGSDPSVRSIILYMENLTRPKKFMSAARAVSRIKPIVVLKSGRSRAGARAAASHTGAMAGEDAVYDAAFQRAGVVRVRTIEELFDCAELLARNYRSSGVRLCIVTNAGGPAVIAADALAEYGIEPEPLSPETLQSLNRVLPPFWSKANPVDMRGDVPITTFCQAVEICLNSRQFDSLLLMTGPQALTDPDLLAASVVETIRNAPIPVITAWMGGWDVKKGRDILNQAGIPAYETPERAIRAFMYLVSYDANQKNLQEIPPKFPAHFHYDPVQGRKLIAPVLTAGESWLTETESKQLLHAYGIPVNPTQVAASARGAVCAAGVIGYPVAMKIHSRDIVHKSDVHGIQLNLCTQEEVESAYDHIMANIRSLNPLSPVQEVTVQTMIEHPDYELIIGSRHTPDFGPIILFGMGGVMTEILKDYAIALPPLNRLLARRLIESTRVYRLLQGYRSRPAANLPLIEEILVRLSQLIVDFPEIVELDINPLILYDDRAVAVDVRVRVKAAALPSPHHLVISPYPNQYEFSMVTRKGVHIFVRPVRPEDAPLMVDLYQTLSNEAVYHRFFRTFHTTPVQLLLRLSQIDYDRQMALAALSSNGGPEKILGIARLFGDPDSVNAEFSVVVEDTWQGHGIGETLLGKCIEIAKERGYRSIWGLVLPENISMLALGKKLGFDIVMSPSGSERELRISFV